MDEESFSAVAKNLLEIIRFGKLTSEGLRVPANLQTMRDNIRKETKNLTEIEQNHLLEEIKLQLQGSNGVIPPFVGLFETRITRPIYTGSFS